jgi:hypothetical protein
MKMHMLYHFIFVFLFSCFHLPGGCKSPQQQVATPGSVACNTSIPSSHGESELLPQLSRRFANICGPNDVEKKGTSAKPQGRQQQKANMKHILLARPQLKERCRIVLQLLSRLSKIR